MSLFIDVLWNKKKMASEFRFIQVPIFMTYTLPETKTGKEHLKMDAWEMDLASFLGPKRPIFRWFLLLVSGRPSYQSLSPSISSTYVWTLGGSLVKTSQASLLGSAKKGLVTPGELTYCRWWKKSGKLTS